MRSHTIALALTDARVADLQRAATHPAASRSHRGALAFVAVAVTTAVVAFAPPGVLAQPTHDVGIIPSPSVAQAPRDLRSADARDSADGRGTFDSPQIIVVKSQPQARPALGNRVDWTDVGIGAGGLFAVGLVGLGGALFVTHRRRAAHTTAPAGL
jgi:hypothetical protein